MIKTLSRNRPFEIFNPVITEHRKAYYDFSKTTSWAKCPYQWIIDDNSADIIACISQKLLVYYADVEFGAGSRIKSAVSKMKESKIVTP